MKKLLLFVALIAATTVSAQFYVSGSAGYAFAGGKKVLGSEDTPKGSKELKGSYGEGIQTQLRGGYFFNDKWGVELAVGYLHGSNQKVKKVNMGTLQAEIEARGRAFGASLSAVYNVTENFYARAGFLTKLGGKTEALGSVNAKLPAQLFNPAAPAGTPAVPLNIDFTRDYKGKFPFGFIGALGYKHPVAENWSIFGEVEYMNINVTRKKSMIGDFSASLGGKKVTRDVLLAQLAALPDQVKGQFSSLAPLLSDELVYVDKPDPKKPKEAKIGDVPYSSFGINFGVIYSFGK